MSEWASKVDELKAENARLRQDVADLQRANEFNAAQARRVERRDVPGYWTCVMMCEGKKLHPEGMSHSEAVALGKTFDLLSSGPSVVIIERVDATIRQLQSSLPWTGHYHRDFRASPMTHKDFAHALLHVTKASGELAGIINEAEHGGFEWASVEKRKRIEQLVADFVVCALRMANTCPEGVIDLQRAVEQRIASKNNQLAEAAPTLHDAERR